MTDNIQLFRRFYHIVETLKIHGEITYGTDDIDVEALVAYLSSDNMLIRCWNAKNEDDVEKLLMQDILDGMPVWKFFHLPQWTQDLLETEWKEICEEEARQKAKQLEEDRKVYKCLQDCAYYDYHESSVGVFVKCRAKHLGGDSFKLCKRCSQYCRKDDTSSLRRNRVLPRR